MFIKRDLSSLFYESDRKSYGNHVRRELGVDKELFHRVSLMRMVKKDKVDFSLYSIKFSSFN